MTLTVRPNNNQARDPEEVRDDVRAVLGPTTYVSVWTCRRNELWSFANSSVPDEDVFQLLRRLSGQEGSDEYIKRGSHAVKHLFELAAGIRSPILGESHIQGQIRDGKRKAEAAGTLDGSLNRLFDAAIEFGRAARRTTQIEQLGRESSYGSGVVELAGSLAEGNLDSSVEVLLYGAGELGREIAHSLSGVGVSLMITNRTIDLARGLAEKLHANWVPWDEHELALKDADVIVSAVPVVPIQFGEAVFRLLETRHGKPLVAIDVSQEGSLSMLRDEPGIRFAELDDLHRLLAPARQRLEGEIGQVQKLAEEKVKAFSRQQEADFPKIFWPIAEKLQRKYFETKDRRLAAFLHEFFEEISTLLAEHHHVLTRLDDVAARSDTARRGAGGSTVIGSSRS
jgi:glutamyl-tRNA reductase